MRDVPLFTVVALAGYGFTIIVLQATTGVYWGLLIISITFVFDWLVQSNENDPNRRG